MRSETERDRPAVECNGVARRFGSQWVLRGVTLVVNRGECVGVLGANGSGKSTLLRILGTLLRPSAGEARVCGFDVVRESEMVRGVIGSLSHMPGLYDDLTAHENLQFAAAMLGVSNTRIPVVLERVGLTGVGSDRVRGFSAGMQRRLAVARLLLHAPKVLLMDEPYSNLDSDGVAVINGVIADVTGSGGAAVVVLHETAPAASILSRCIRIEAGRAVSVPLVPSQDGERRARPFQRSMGAV